MADRQIDAGWVVTSELIQYKDGVIILVQNCGIFGMSAMEMPTILH